MKPWISRLIVIASLSTLSACGGGTNALTPNSPPPTPNQWTWVSGSKIANHAGMYGSLGTAAASNVSGTRWAAAGCIGTGGDLWFFGGNGYGSVGTDLLNHLWNYSAGQWAWVSGADTVGQPGTYGAQATASPSHAPGARLSAVGWTDASAKFLALRWRWNRLDGDIGLLNDLWKFEPQIGT
jgi:hypothetical protein